MTRMLRLTSVLVLAAFALAACDDDDDNDTAGGGGGGGGGGPQDQFGATFAQAFNADPNSEPIDPQPGDAGPLSLTDEPVDF